jgi:2-keto-4-pentenoate hydratase
MPESPLSDRAVRIAAAAEALTRAGRTRTPIATLTTHWPELDEGGAYAIARASEALRAEPRVGYKLGYTSAAMRAQMGVDQPNYGVLTAATRVAHDGQLAMAELIHPLVEPEIAFVMAADVPDPAGTAAAVGSVHAALEIVDTRYEAYKFKAADNIADNSSAARFVIGPAMALPPGSDLAALPVQLWADGELLGEGRGADALGHPLTALTWLAERLLKAGALLRAGDVVLTGGLTRAHPARSGRHFTARVGEAAQGGGEVTLRFV